MQNLWLYVLINILYMIIWKDMIIYVNIIFIYYNVKFDLTWKISCSLRMQMGMLQRLQAYVS